MRSQPPRGGFASLIYVQALRQPEYGSGAAAAVYYWRTWYKAVSPVCGGKGGSEGRGHVLRDTTSRGLWSLEGVLSSRSH